jgi:predicted transcriptional regulator
MKTMTITISDEAARALDAAAAATPRTAEQVASRVVETAFVEDWGDLDADDVAAIEEGLADIERGETVPHEQVVAAIKFKHGC